VRRYRLRVICESLGIVAGLAGMSGIGLWVFRARWEAPPPPALRPPGPWVPYRLPSTDLYCWPPSGWQLRVAHVEEGRLVMFCASPVAYVLVAVQGGEGGAADQTAEGCAALLQAALAVLSRRSGFRHGRPEARALAGGTGWASWFSYWQLAGLRLIAWHGWLWVGQGMGRRVRAALSSDRPHWQEFLSSARVIVGTLAPLPRSRGAATRGELEQRLCLGGGSR
jgi:hypothetical protein